jgi:hypothetical protein
MGETSDEEEEITVEILSWHWKWQSIEMNLA